MTDELLSSAELAAELKLPIGTLRQWRHNGVGPASFKIGPQTVRYRRSEVTRWLAEQEARERQTRPAA